jgi:hypothetical protein
VVDPVVRQGPLQWLSDVVLTYDLGESIGPVPPVKREWGAYGRAATGVEQRLILSVLDPV